jgi:OOP family OmpA-OmpF porin
MSSLRSVLGSASLVGVLAVVASGCAATTAAQAKLAKVEDALDKAERAGAQKCAPRELALGRSHARFARVELDEGRPSHALAQLAFAEPEAESANLLSPPEKCREDVTIPKPGDLDGDGIPDAKDRCPRQPETFNSFEDDDGCPDDPDTDKDGVADSVDACVLEAEDRDNYLDDDGCPDPDDDADGVLDAQDKCPREPEDLDGFEDTDGCPEPDNDKDGVLDEADICPNSPGVPGGVRPGCPFRDAPVIVTAKEVRITQQIQFDTGKATIKKPSYPTLDAVRDVLKAFPAMTLEIQGHTDNAGQAAYNTKLSQQRADSVRKYLTDRGIEGSRLTAKGYGPSQPLLPNNTEANRALNRRVQFIRTESAK